MTALVGGRAWRLWQLCEHANFGGRCGTLTPGSYPSLGSMGMRRCRIVGRPLGSGSSLPSRPTAGGRTRGRVVLYEVTDFSGRSIAIDQVVSNLDRVGFNDRAIAWSSTTAPGNCASTRTSAGSLHDAGNRRRVPELGRLNRKVSSAATGEIPIRAGRRNACRSSTTSRAFVASSRIRARSRSSGCPPTGTDRASSRRNTCRTTDIG